MGSRPLRLRRRRRRRLALAFGAACGAAFVWFGIWLWWSIAGATPLLQGRVALHGLAAPVEVERDAAGVPTVTAANRLDLARALGFLHAQERFFQMDLLRRTGAGELSELVGPAALPLDRAHRLHRFRARAEALLAQLPPEHRALLTAYADGVNGGLDALARKPFEYTLLGAVPQRWRPADTLLVVYAMYFDLQDSDGWSQQRAALAETALGPALAAFLYPRDTPAAAALDGSVLPEPPLPGQPAPAPPADAPAAVAPPAMGPPAGNGSNAFAVAGRLTASGAAMVANDMHLSLAVPNIWFRVRMRVAAPGRPVLDLDGVTLPGAPTLIAGSNGRVAWGYTDSYVETGDAVLLDPVRGDPLGYRTPDGPARLQVATEQLCPAGASCQPLAVEESIWGPVVARAADGRRIVWRWAAQDAGAIDLGGLLALEEAGSVRQALDAAHHAGMPQLNLIVGDRDGHIGWTVAGRLPKRFGLDDGLPHSWADGKRGWAGDLAPDEVPEVVDPPDGILWSANNRMVGGPALEKLGDGGYADPGRAREIRDDLRARQRFAEADLLAIQLDARTPILAPYQALLMKLAAARAEDPRFAAMIPYLRDWGGAATVGSVGYRLVRSFEELAIRLVYGGFGRAIRHAAGGVAGPLVATKPDDPVLRLLTERPAGLVPPPYRSWDAVNEALLDGLAARVDEESGGRLDRFTWGARNHDAIHHPMANAVPLLGRLTDPPDQPVDGDRLPPHVVTPGFGASERFVVSPGHEGDGIFEMPVGEAGNPATPYYLAGHADWVLGRPSPFLPGPRRWRLTLEPG